MKCEICNKETDGTYKEIPICFEHYENGTLREWLNKEKNNGMSKMS